MAIAAEAPQAPPTGAAGKNHAPLKLPWAISAHVRLTAVDSDVR
jgi:hypothetical protein